MRICLAKFLESLSIALDFVEKEILNVQPYHGQRVASIVYLLGKNLDFDKEILFSITYAALLHDCALNEYLIDEKPNEKIEVNEKNMALHCIEGEKILSKLPFYEKVKGAVLFHHDTADGTGAFEKKYMDIPLYSRLIHLADIIDVNWNLYEKIDEIKFGNICQWVKTITGSVIDLECSNLFFKSIDLKFLQSISGNSVIQYLHSFTEYNIIDIPNEAMIDLCSIYADITDYKSHFTWRHSLGVAEKALKMAEYYNYSTEDCQKLYIAGALHDIGKLMISNSILEKPGKLSSEEYKTIQNHAFGTYKLLENIYGLEEINRIASLHHEKLNGSGYPFGYKEKDLNKNEKLMACIDIYQALVEERPYKSGLAHNIAIDILNKMGNEGQLDNEIIKDIDKCFKDNSNVSSAINVIKDNRNNSNINDQEIWICPVCGYRYEGKLPEDFICPRCEQPASIFEKQ